MAIYSELIIIYLLCWFFTSFEPIQELIDRFFEDRKSTFANSMWQLLGCQYCLTLWIAFGYTQNFLIACGLSIIAQIHSKIIK